MSIDNVLSDNQDAQEHRNQEFEHFEVHPGPPGDPEGHMQRLRVTPQKYGRKAVMKEVESNESIVYLDNEYFNY